MPLVRKRALHDDAASKDQAKANPQKRARVQTTYNEFDKIGYTQDQFHTLFRQIPDSIERLEKLLSKHLGCFLNGRGGILCFGVRENGTIYGESISRSQEDNLKNIIDTTLKKFHPLVHPAKYRVSFTPVKTTSMRNTAALQVLEIRMNPGDKYQMYEDMDHQVHMRKGGVYATLTPHEIKHLTVLQLRKKMEEEAISNAKSSPPSTSSSTDQVKSNDVKSKDVKSNDVKSKDVKSNDVKSNDVKSNDVKSNDVKKEAVAVSKLKSCVVKVDIKRDQKTTHSHLSPSYPLPAARPSFPLPPAHQAFPPRPYPPMHSVIPPYPSQPMWYSYNQYYREHWFGD